MSWQSTVISVTNKQTNLICSEILRSLSQYCLGEKIDYWKWFGGNFISIPFLSCLFPAFGLWTYFNNVHFYFLGKTSLKLIFITKRNQTLVGSGIRSVLSKVCFNSLCHCHFTEFETFFATIFNHIVLVNQALITMSIYLNLFDF